MVSGEEEEKDFWAARRVFASPAEAALLFLGVTLLCAPAEPALAHHEQTSHSDLVVEGRNVLYTLRVPAIYLRQLDEDGDAVLTNDELWAGTTFLEPFLLGGLRVQAEGRPCTGAYTGATVAEQISWRGARLPSEPVHLSLSYRCPASPQKLTLRFRLMVGVQEMYQNLVTVEAYGKVHELLVTEERTVVTAELGPAPTQTAEKLGRALGRALKWALLIGLVVLIRRAWRRRKGAIP